MITDKADPTALAEWTGPVEPLTVLRRCQHCGRTGSDVEVGVSLEYAGGHGYVEQMLCRNRVKCWTRFDEQMANFRALELRNDEDDYQARGEHDPAWLGRH